MAAAIERDERKGDTATGESAYLIEVLALHADTGSTLTAGRA